MRSLTPLALAAALAAAATAAPAADARAQIAGVPTPPRVRRPPAEPLVARDSATRAAQTSAQSEDKQRSRLDIQAWVDSAAGALARTPPAPIPAPGRSGRPSIFSTPAVPDSLRPPPAGTAGNTDAAGRSDRARRRRTARPRP